MKEQLLQVLQEQCPDVDFTTGADLVDDGILDSLAMVELISAISMEFGVSLPYEEIVPENFNSVDAMVELLQKYI